MNEIKYQTEGKVQIDCNIGNTKPMAVSWRKGDYYADLYQGPHKLELSKSQLLQLADLAGTIAADLLTGKDTE